MLGETIPVIDLEKISEQFKFKKLRDACEKWGCFMIINHSIPLTLIKYFKPFLRSIRPLWYDMGSSQAMQDFCSQLNATPHQRYAYVYFKKIEKKSFFLLIKIHQSPFFNRIW